MGSTAVTRQASHKLRSAGRTDYLWGAIAHLLGSFRSAPALASPLEIGNQLRKFVIFGIEVGHRQLEDRRKALQGLQVGLVYACFVTVDTRAGDEFVQAGLDAQGAL